MDTLESKIKELAVVAREDASETVKTMNKAELKEAYVDLIVFATEQSALLKTAQTLMDLQEEVHNTSNEKFWYATGGALFTFMVMQFLTNM